MLYPFWGTPPEDPSDPSSGRFDRYSTVGREYFRMSSLKEADLAVLPGAWEYMNASPEGRKRSGEFLDMVKQGGKQALVFFWSDDEAPLCIDGATVFRTSLRASQKKPNEFAMPAWSEDFIAKYLGGSVRVREKNSWIFRSRWAVHRASSQSGSAVVKPLVAFLCRHRMELIAVNRVPTWGGRLFSLCPQVQMG